MREKKGKTLKKDGVTIKISPETHKRLKDKRFDFRVETISEALEKLLDYFEESNEKEKGD